MLEIFKIITPLFLIILLGVVIQKYKNVEKEWGKVLNEYALKIGIPVLIFSSLSNLDFSFKNEGVLIISNSIFIIFNFILALIVGKLLRLNKKMFLTLFICFTFGNTAYLGIPVLTQTKGLEILSTTSLIIAIYLFWIFSIGIGYLEYSTQKTKEKIIKNTLKSLTKNSILIAIFLSLIVNFLKIPIPQIISTSFNMINASVTPTVLIVIGLFIGTAKIGKISEWVPVVFFTIFTLLIFPAIFYFGVKLMNFPTEQFSISIIQASMPLAITPFALSDKYNLNKNFITRAIILSTILSIFSLTFWISIL